MFPPNIADLISNPFFIFGVVFILVVIIRPIAMIIGFLLARYSKNYRLTSFYFTCILFIAPWYATGYGSRGLARLRLKEYDKAMKDCKRALKLNPNLYWVYNNKGVLYQRAKQYKEALIEFDKSIKLKPDYRLPYFNSVHINIKLKNYEQALEDIEAYIAIKGKKQEAASYCTRGTIYLYLKDYVHALQEFDYSLELDPGFALSYHNRGFALLAMNHVQQGFESITRAYALNPKSVHFNWTFEWCRMSVEQPNDTTAERLETLAKLAPEYHLAYTSRGVALWLRGNFEDAVKELEQALVLEPDSEDSYFWIGIVYASLGQDEKAIVALRKAQAIGVPRVLLTPLYLLGKTQPAFFEKYAPEFLALYTNG